MSQVHEAIKSHSFAVRSRRYWLFWLYLKRFVTSSNNYDLSVEGKTDINAHRRYIYYMYTLNGYEGNRITISSALCVLYYFSRPSFPTLKDYFSCDSDVQIDDRAAHSSRIRNVRPSLNLSHLVAYNHHRVFLWNAKLENNFFTASSVVK